jgi:tagaturonate reductase
LLSISLNSVSKYRTRVLPSVEQYLAMKGELPARLTFALAALITFYRGTEVRDGALIGHRSGEEYRIQDSQAILETFARLWSKFDGSGEGTRKLTEAVLQRESWWGKDLRQLPGLSRAVSGYVESVLNRGMRATLQDLN